MATSSERAKATRVLLVDPQSLPVLLQGDPDGSAGDISAVDLLQQALQGTSGIDGGDEGEPSGEVSLGALSGGSNDVVAIYQGEEGQTHTIKISLAQAQSLGLNFSNGSFPVTIDDDSLVGGVKVASVEDQLTGSNSGTLNNASILQSVTCSNVPTEGRIIDEEGNIVETTESLQILPTSLSSLLDDGMSQSLSIIPQYELDGTVTYAVKLKDQNDSILNTDYHVLEPDTSAKTGLDIEEELKTSSLKQNILHTSGAITAESIRLQPGLSLNNDANQSSSAIQVPISALEAALSKQMLLPVSSASVPISLTLSMPTETTVSSNTPCMSSALNNLTTDNAGRFFQIVTGRNSIGLNNVISSDSTNVSLNPLNTIVPQSTLAIAQQQGQLINPNSTMLSIQSSPASLLNSSRNINRQGPPTRTLSDKVPILPSPKSYPVSNLKTTASVKKSPISSGAVAPTAIATTSLHSPTMASVAPQTAQPNLGVAAVSKSGLPNGRASSSNSNSSKPLGSSENPIQLVQQGQTFHSMQALSQAQLRQIATVLQQKHLNSNSVATKNVLFDEQTKTRIVYRVVYPEDVDLQQPSFPQDKSGSSSSQSAKNLNLAKGRRGRPKKGRRTKQQKSEKQFLNTGQVISVPEPPNFQTIEVKGGSKDENETHEVLPKAGKKKIVPVQSRTRSGRVSRPPKHMMKDFKRLHHTDYTEKDDCDSDGGYSDYSNPEQPPEKPSIKEVDLSPVKKRFSRFTCPTCGKMYLGLGRMEKHFFQHPDHGSFEEFKLKLSASVSTETSTGEDTPGGRELKTSSPKGNTMRGKKRSQISSHSVKESSEMRKKKLKQAAESCEISEVMEVVGPLIARYYSLWDLLLLRLMSRDEPAIQKDSSARNAHHLQTKLSENNLNFDPEALRAMNVGSVNLTVESNPVNSHKFLSTSNRVQWLLMELGSLADTLQSLAGELFHPPLLHGEEKSQIEISQKTISDLLGVSCGTYSVNEEFLLKKIEAVATASSLQISEDSEIVPEKRPRKQLDDAQNMNLNAGHEGPDGCCDALPSLALMAKPVDDEKAMLAKLTEDMPFLNSSDDMICGSEDPDLSTDGKRDQDCDPAAGLQAVDDIVNERLNNLSENMNFSVPLQGGLAASNLNGEQSDLHLMPSFGGTETSMSVSNSSVISNSLTNNKPAVVSSIGLMGSYSLSSLTRPGAHDVNISNAEPPNDIASALEPVSSHSMLGSFEMGLSSLTSFDTLQSQSSSVSHSEDSFLESLSSFETPLTQSCSSSNAPGSSFSDSVMKSNTMLQLSSESSEPSSLPPKFISTFTPAITSDKSANSISTAQRLQRSYLELDSGLDDGLDIDFEAFTQELSMNRNNSA